MKDSFETGFGLKQGPTLLSDRADFAALRWRGLGNWQRQWK
jgi:hypothetical protein